MVTKQLGGLNSPDGSQYVTLTDGNGNLVTPSVTGGLVVGTTPITGGSNTQIFYNNAGVLGSEAIPSSSIVVGSTVITGGTSGQVLYNNAGVVGTEAPPGGTITVGTTTITSGTTNELLYDVSGVVQQVPVGTASQVLSTQSSGKPAFASTILSVSVKDFGAIGDGQRHLLSTIYGSLAAAQAVYPWVDDLTPEVDYCAIQSAIDYAYNNLYRTITVPRGAYCLTAPIFLDAPNSMRDQVHNNAGGVRKGRYNPASTYSTGDIVQYNGIPWIALQNVPINNAPFFGTINIFTLLPPAQSVYWQFYYACSANGSSNAALSNVESWAASLIGEPGQWTAGTLANGTSFVPDYINGPCVYIGPLNGGTASDFNVYFSPVADVLGYPYGIGINGGQNPYGIGVAIAATGGGSSRTVLENVGVVNCYTAFQFGATGGPLGDSNVCRRLACSNCYMGIITLGTQNFIDGFYDCNIAATIGININRGIANVYGGNWSAEFEQTHANTFAVTGTTAFAISTGSGFYAWGSAVFPYPNPTSKIVFTTHVTTPDSNLITLSYTDGRAGVYNSFAMNTANYGVVPLICTNYNAGTQVITLEVFPPWMDFFVGNNTSFLTSTDFQNEIVNCTKLYAVESVFTFQCSVATYGCFIENICTTILNSNQSYGPSILSGLYFDADVTLSNYAPAVQVNDSLNAQYFVQKSFPFIFANTDVILDSVRFQAPDFTYDTINTYCTSFARVIVRDCTYSGSSLGTPPINPSFTMLFGPLAAQGGVTYRRENTFVGNLVLDINPNVPTKQNPNTIAAQWLASGGACRTLGFRPDPNIVPMVRPDYVATIGNPQALPAISNTACDYPLIYGGTIYQTSTPHLPGNFLVESSHDYYSYHQDLTTSNISGLAWTAKGQSPCIYMDANSMSMMFLGLVIGLTTNAGINYYVVTGIYTQLNYVTVYDITSGAGSPTYIGGTKNHVYSSSVEGGNKFSAQPYRVRIVSGAPVYKTTTYTAIVGQEILADTSGGAWTLTLPTNPIQDDKIIVRDAAGIWNTNNLTIARNSSGTNDKINSGTSNLTETVNGATVVLIYINSTIGWKTY